MLDTNEVPTANKVSGVEGGNKLIEKYKKLSKTRKLSKFQKLAKSRKESSKSGNLPNFDAKKNGPSFPTPNAKMAFNCLWLAFTKATIFGYFDLKCLIQIKTDVSGYAIDDVLS